jgi:hypothetical protein
MPLCDQAAGPKPAQAAPSHGRLARWGVALGSLCMTFVCAEIALRAIGCRPRTATVLSTYVQPDRALGWIGRPNAACRFVTSSFDVEITHGPDGFRTCPLGPPAGDSSTEVVWCLGDSCVWGWGVPDGQTFVDELNRRCGPRRVFRNLGISAFNTVQEYLLLRAMLEQEAVPPVQVLLTFCDNDLDDNLSPWQPHLVPQDELFLIGDPLPTYWGRRWTSWLKRHSLAFNYLDFYLAQVKNRINERNMPAESPGPLATVAEQNARQEPPWTDSLAWRALHHGYRLIRELCDAREIRFSVVWQGEQPAPPQLVAVTSDLSIPLLDLSGSMREQRDAAHFEDSIRFPRDGHYTQRGHELVARAIEAQLFAPALARRP